MNPEAKKRLATRNRVRKYRALVKSRKDIPLRARDSDGLVDSEPENVERPVNNFNDAANDDVKYPIKEENELSQSSYDEEQVYSQLLNSLGGEEQVRLPLPDSEDDAESGTSSEAVDNIGERQDESEEIRRWMIEHHITHSQLDKLLLILRRRSLPNLPEFAKSFMKTSSAIYDIRQIEGCEESKSRHKESRIDETSQKQSIWSAIQDMRFEIQQQTQAIKELKSVVENSAIAPNVYGSKVESFASQHNLSLPLTHIEDFNEFDLKLQQSKTFREEFTSTLHFLVDTETTLSRNITAVMKKHLARDVALQFTAVKASVGKSIFKQTTFCRCLLDVLLERYKHGGQGAAIKEKNFYIELGHVLCNAIDWDGQRKQRKKKVQQPISTESVEK